ncbi:hypothetical protein CVT25_007644 [Psilocybe cyanescens]|uniref:Uncharacterized protein n=1 Tax=Psilocybe cyanescens TaxID=93625 RepID=A0A409X1B4_PSICY|nr:hypothetical protein CVT25_007644 [Psilocybe cyanescens]
MFHVNYDNPPNTNPINVTSSFFINNMVEEAPESQLHLPSPIPHYASPRVGYIQTTVTQLCNG